MLLALSPWQVTDTSAVDNAAGHELRVIAKRSRPDHGLTWLSSDAGIALLLLIGGLLSIPCLWADQMEMRDEASKETPKARLASTKTTTSFTSSWTKTFVPRC